MTRTVLKIFVPLLILAVGLLIARQIIARKTLPQPTPPAEVAVLVDVIVPEPAQGASRIAASGTVTPLRQTVLAAQVAARVERIHPALLVGGVVTAGTELIVFDSADMVFRLKQAEAALSAAIYELEVIEAKRDLARTEWEQFTSHRADAAALQPTSLVLYEPQVRNAKAALASAQASVENAALNVARSTVVAPYDALVTEKLIDEGQFVTVGAKLATVAAIDVAEVEIPLAQRDFEQIDWKQPPMFTVTRPSQNAPQWHGVLHRSRGTVDAARRTVMVIGRVSNPYSNKGQNTPLEFGTFVNVVIAGKSLQGLTRLPHRALREQNTLWVVENTQTLAIRPVSVVWSEPDSVYIRETFAEGETVVTSPLSAPLAGMRVRVGTVHGTTLHE
ncbi:efflux RND transporter periplasmic adaptor subunit [Chrysiogenes arsenatis]|uniref:efflux RND transporter periplasmic adaptor subunit n=1 Tax=Chrysiogenes arsenatis TaxID=309797 RepID=UPI00040001CB|nr:efflux RND transporter periplasmic adaptor subunit [Chrysiogenes arsenatis]